MTSDKHRKSVFKFLSFFFRVPLAFFHDSRRIHFDRYQLLPFLYFEQLSRDRTSFFVGMFVLASSGLVSHIIASPTFRQMPRDSTLISLAREVVKRLSKKRKKTARSIMVHVFVYIDWKRFDHQINRTKMNETKNKIFLTVEIG